MWVEYITSSSCYHMLHKMYCSVTEYILVKSLYSNITTAMNAGYNATLFILQQEYIRVYMFTKVLVGILQKQLCLPITR